MAEHSIQDPLYGEVQFGGILWKLVLTPAVQRLRGIRLSNVDSMSLPGFAGVTRYEHSLGTAVVAAHLGFLGSLKPEERLVLRAAALVHDTAITPFGHLVEEAFTSVGRPFDHEKKWEQLFDERRSAQPGGAQSQVYLGRESGFRWWAEKAFGAGRWRVCLDAVISAVRGEGVHGPAIAGQVDVDNIDNVTRAAFHMGIPCDTKRPKLLAKAIKGVKGTLLIVDDDSVRLVADWLALRRAVYSKLMAAQLDYSGKAMLLAAATAACKEGVIREDDWRRTDSEFTRCILSSRCERAKKPLTQWLLGELWDLTDIVWMKGEVPSLPETFAFSEEISREFGRCMAYRIVDKRNRKVRLRLTSGQEIALGEESKNWLFGVAIERRLPKRARTEILERAQVVLGATILGDARERRRTEPTLFGR